MRSIAKDKAHKGASEAKLLPRIKRPKAAPYGAGVLLCRLRGSSKTVPVCATSSCNWTHEGAKHEGASVAKLLPRIDRAKPAPYGAGIFRCCRAAGTEEPSLCASLQRGALVDGISVPLPR